MCEPSLVRRTLTLMAEIEIRIAKPCPQSWHSMQGDERVRFCGVCEKNVFNISQMTTAEVEELIRRTDGRFCARLYRRPDNRVMTKDCPMGMARYRRRRTLALLRVGATMIFGGTLAGCMGSTGGGDVGDTKATRSTGKIAVIPKRDLAEPTTGSQASTLK